MRKIIIFVFINIFSVYPLFSQVTQQWVKLFQNNYAKSLAIDNSGNVYVTGWGWGNGYNTLKYNAAGVQQWASQYRGIDNGNDFAFSIAVDRFGNVYVTGWSQGGGNATDIVTIKYSPTGDSSWVQRYRGPGVSSAVPGFEQYLKLIAVDDSGNVYVTGTSYGGTSTGYDYAAIKYNPAGVQQWVQRYNNPAANAVDYATAIALDASGNVYVSGFSDANSSGTIEDFCTIKYSPGGVQQWVSRYNNGAHNRVNSLALDNSGNIYVTGWGGPSTINGPGGYLTVKYDNSGTQQWASAFPGSTYDEATAIAVYGSNVYVTGGLIAGSTNSDYLTIKYNSSGVQQWTKTYNGPVNGYDKANAIAVDKSGNIYVTGTSNAGGSTFDYASVKYDDTGALQWIVRYNETGSSNCNAVAIAVDTSYNFYVSGSSGTKYMTIKYSQVTGITPVSGNIPNSFYLSQNYPNPFNPSTRIRFDVPTAEAFRRVALKVFDILGKEITTLVNEQFEPGSYEITFDGTNLASGLYFYRLVAGDFTETKKMLMIK
jgi:hypothetical protein